MGKRKIMYKCLKCNKEFKYESEFNRHNSNKRPCIKSNNILKCDICNIIFTRPSHKILHEKTKKHISNYNIYNSNVQIGDNNLQNIVNLTLHMNTFKDTDMSYIGIGLLRDIGNYIYLEILDNKKLNIHEKVSLMFDEVIRILKKLHFNIGVEENHNLKILLVFPGLRKKTYEYLILEINKDTKQITWKSVDYNTLLINILDHLLILNNHCKNQNYIEFVNYLNKHLIENKDSAKLLQPIIDHKLSQMYIDFNKEQNKSERDIKETFNEKLHEYINYRNQECRLDNGYNPEIINSKF